LQLKTNTKTAPQEWPISQFRLEPHDKAGHRNTMAYPETD